MIGHIQVDDWAEQPTRAKTTELAVYLALHADRPVAAERLRTVMWTCDSVPWRRRSSYNEKLWMLDLLKAVTYPPSW